MQWTEFGKSIKKEPKTNNNSKKKKKLLVFKLLNPRTLKCSSLVVS